MLKQVLKVSRPVTFLGQNKNLLRTFATIRKNVKCFPLPEHLKMLWYFAVILEKMKEKGFCRAQLDQR